MATRRRRCRVLAQARRELGDYAAPTSPGEASRSASGPGSRRSTSGEDVLRRHPRRDRQPRVGGGRAGEPAGRLARPAGRRARPRAGRRVPARQGHRPRVGARRLRRRAQRRHARHLDPATCQHALRQARRLARTSAAARSRTATARSGRSPRSAATTASPSSPACAEGVRRLDRGARVPPAPAPVAHAALAGDRRLDHLRAVPARHRRAVFAQVSVRLSG